MHQNFDEIRLHQPVMMSEVIEFIRVIKGGQYLDGTFGEGGHSERILELGAHRLVGNDRDTLALQRYREVGKFRNDPRLTLVQGPLSTLALRLKGLGVPPLDGILLDLGVSTRQLKEDSRGFSFQIDGPLDMRMDTAEGTPTLQDLLSTTSEKTLADVLAPYVPSSRRLAARILDAFTAGTLKSTGDLARLMGSRRGPRHPATRLFMALRLWVNREREEVESAVPQLAQCLRPGGRLVVITFHSDEDRWVKRQLLKLAGRCGCQADPCLCSRVECVRPVLKKPLEPTRLEQRHNPRARSAKLRCVEKL